MKTGLHDRLTAAQRDRLAPDTGPMTGSSNNQQPSTIRGEAHTAVVSVGLGSDPCAAVVLPDVVLPRESMLAIGRFGS